MGGGEGGRCTGGGPSDTIIDRSSYGTELK